MAKYFNLAAAALLAAAAMSASAPAAQQIGQAPVGEPAVPQSHSVEQADARLAEVAKGRAAVEAEYAAAEQVCNAKFFVNYCLDGAKEKRRAALAGLRAIEVEANHFKRKYAVDKRDAELAERMKKDEEELARRVQNPPAPHAEREPAKPAAKPGPSLEQRQAEHDAKVTAQAAKDAAEAPKRAAAVAAFEKKKAESEKRQADIAAKKAAKEEKARKRQADAAAQAEKEAAREAAAKAK
ncbi:hypothetical protein [Pseudoduganella sp. UC29_71]|uniref:hypothetical protein n=1 Tax=Pseudoduganella sp. UC29_71 TaxID=3350174 RepID=UPI00366A586C